MKMYMKDISYFKLYPVKGKIIILKLNFIDILCVMTYNVIKKGSDCMKAKDDRLSLRINSEDKKKIQKRSIDKGFKNLSDYVMYACNEEMKKDK